MAFYHGKKSIATACLFIAALVLSAGEIEPIKKADPWRENITSTKAILSGPQYFIHPLVPGSNTRTPGCSYGANGTCRSSQCGVFHTGIDEYANRGIPVRAANFGERAFIVVLGMEDTHGMGNAVGLRYLLSDGTFVWDQYAHMDNHQPMSQRPDNTFQIPRASKVGEVGSTGGDWGPHLHYEMKLAGVSGRPFCDGSNCCGYSDCWGYVCDHPDLFGYLNPDSFFGTREILLPTLGTEANSQIWYGSADTPIYAQFELRNASEVFDHLLVSVRTLHGGENLDFPAREQVTGNVNYGTYKTLPAGDYVFFANMHAVGTGANEWRTGYRMIFSVLPKPVDLIRDNDMGPSYFTAEGLSGLRGDGYGHGSLIAKGSENARAKWIIRRFGPFRMAFFNRGLGHDQVRFEISPNGQDVVLSDPVDLSQNAYQWVPLTVNGLDTLNFSELGYVALATLPDTSDDDAVYSFDAIRFIYEGTAPEKVGHYRDGWRSDRHSQFFLDAYWEHHGLSLMGNPYDNGSGPYIHWWGTSGEGVWIQDFYKADAPRYGNGQTALIYTSRESGKQKAFLVKEDFWQFYKSHHGNINFGAPRKNEFVRPAGVFQLFEKAMLKWDPATDEVSVYRELAGPPLQTVPVLIKSDTPGVSVYNNGDMIGTTPFQFDACERCTYEMEAEDVNPAKNTHRQKFQFTADPTNPIVDVEAEPPAETVTLSGKVTRTDGYPIWDVVLSGLDGHPKTDNRGGFSVEIPRGANLTIKPVKQYYTFVESPLTITNAQTDITDISFTGRKIEPLIPLRVTLNGSGLQGVRFGGLSGNAYTDSNGEYLAELHVGWEGSIRPLLQGYSFSPASFQIDFLEEDLPQVEFTAVARTSVISGRIMRHDSPLAGVVMQGLPGNPITDAEGRYSATVPYAWAGTVTPTAQGLVITPESRSYMEVFSNKFDEDYMAQYRGYTISGKITESGAPLADTWLTGLPAGVLSDASGSYAALVNHGWSETISPLKLGYQFNPADTTLAPVITNQSGVNFAASLLPGERRIWIVKDVPEFNQATVFADPGDIIYVKPGVYIEPRLISLNEGVTLLSEAGPEQTIIQLSYYSLNDDNTTFDGFTFQGLTTTETLHLNSVSNILIRNCIFKPAAGNYGIRIHQSENVIIEGNVIGDATSRGILVRAGNGGGSITIRNNYFPKTQRAINGGSNLSFSIIAHNNHFDGNNSAVDLDDIHAFVFYNNIVANCSNGGIYLGDMTTTAQIYQNTFVGNDRAAEIGDHALTYNNLFRNNDRHIDGQGSNPNINIHHTFYGPGNLLYCCANFIVDWGTTLELDPQFVDQAGGDYHLLPSSPAIQAGQSGYDLGAYGGPAGNTWSPVPGLPQALPALIDFQLDGPQETSTGRTVPMQAKAFYYPNYFSWVQHLVTWSSSNPSVLEHFGVGRFLAHAPGSAVVTGVFEGQSRSIAVEVLDSAVDAAMTSVQMASSSKREGDPQLMLFINYTNTGEGGASNVEISADFDPAFSFISALPTANTGTDSRWTIPYLQPGESGTITITGSIPASLGNDAALISYVQIDADFGNEVQIQEITQIAGVPELAMVVDADSPVIPGESVLVTVTLSNSGTATAQNSNLHAAYDPLIRFLAASPSPTAEINDWDLGFLGPGEQISLVLELQIDPFLAPNITLRNLFTFSADYVAEAQALHQLITAAPVADLDVVQFTDQDYAIPGIPLTYWLLVTNRGPSSASALMLSEALPEGASIIEASHAYAINGQNVEMALGNLDPGASLTVLLALSPSGGTALDLSANLIAAEVDPDPANNTAPASLPIAYPPEATIDAPAGNVTITIGDVISFAGSGIDPDGQTPLRFLWDFDGAAPSTTVEDPGEVVFTTAGVYRITFSVTDDLGITDPTPATVTVTVNENQAPQGVIDTPSEDTTLCLGASLSFSSTAHDPDGHEPLAYGWDFEGAAPISNLEDPGEIPFNQTGSFVITLTVRDARQLEDPTPATVQVTILEPAAFTSHPSSATRCLGEAISFAVTASGDGPLSYQWYKDGSAIPSAQSAALTIASVSAADAATYTCMVTNACGTITSQGATLTVLEPAGVASQPVGGISCVGEVVAFEIGTSGTGPFSYQWFKDGQPIVDAVSAILTISAVAGTDAGIYSCAITNACATTMSEPAALVVHDPVTIDTQPQNTTLCPGDTLSLNVSAQGSQPLTYQWYYAGVPIAGGNQPVLTLPSVTLEDAGLYHCAINNDCGPITSQAVTLVVEADAMVAVSPHAHAQGLDPLMLDALITCAAPGYAWQWRNLNTGDTFGENQAAIILPVLSETTRFEVEVNDGFGIATDSATILVPQNTLYTDLNDDGCNSLVDLFLLAQEWLSLIPLFDDPNGDGIIDIRDFLYINLDDLDPCVP